MTAPFFAFITLQFLQPSPVLANLSFESFVKSDHQFDHWYAANSQAVSPDSLLTTQGNLALRLTSSESSAFFTQAMHFDKGHFRRFQIKGDVYLHQSGLTAGLFTTIQSKTGRTYYNQDLLSTSGQWATSQIEVLVDSAATTVYVGGLLSGIGSATFDDLHVMEKQLSNDGPSGVVAEYLDKIASIIRKQALVYDESGRVENLLARASLFASLDSTIGDAYPVVSQLFQDLGDGHSRFRTKDQYTSWKNRSPEEIQFPSGEILENKIALLRIPSFRTGDEEVVNAYVIRLSALITTMAADSPVGWVVDLRQNGGGNAYAMLLGLSPLLGEAEYARMTNRSGVSKSLRYSEQSLQLGDSEVLSSGEQLPSVDAPSLAVLVGTDTASAGELVAISLKSLASTSVVGQTTAGLTSNTEAFELADGSALFLATSYYSDTRGIVYKNGVTPDVVVSKSDQDLCLDQATNWLLKQGN